MPSYNLPLPQEQIVTSWLFEPFGYLDVATNDQGISAFQALETDPGLDVTLWIRTNIKHADTAQSDWEECGMVWWIRANDQVNWSRPALKAIPERLLWISRLQVWDQSIIQGFGRTGQGARDAKSVTLFGTNQQVIGTQPAGQNLSHQQGMINKVLGLIDF